MKNLVGHFVFLERINESGQGVDYNSGEYIIVNQTPMTLYAVKSSSDIYSVHNLLQFFVEGTRPWRVVKEYIDNELLNRFILKIELQLKNEDVEGKRQWVNSVYSSARANIDLLKRTITEPNDTTKISNTITLGIRDGKIVLI
jgi:hypothetical protein